jgi:hypothetical protein
MLFDHTHMLGFQFIQRCVTEFRVMRLDHTHKLVMDMPLTQQSWDPIAKGLLQNPVEHRIPCDEFTL